MNTQTHLLVAAALFCRPNRPKRNAAVIAGAFVPDLGVYALFVWSKLAGVPEREVWRTIYFGEPMQTVQAVFNSVPLYAMLLIAGMMLLAPASRPVTAGNAPTRPNWGWWRFVDERSALGLFAFAALVHLAGDLPLHAEDAHRHFWPLTDWRFYSPVSYWDPSHYGNVFSWVEAALGAALAVVLFRRFRAWWVRALCVLAIAFYVGVPLYFTLMLGGS